MVGGVEVGAVVGADVGALDGGVFAVGELVDADPHVFGHRGGGLVVVEVFDLRQRVGWVALDAGFEGNGNVDQAAGHFFGVLNVRAVSRRLASLFRL